MAEAHDWLQRDWISPGMELIPQGGKTGKLFVLREGELEVVRDGKYINSISQPGRHLRRNVRPARCAAQRHGAGRHRRRILSSSTMRSRARQPP